MNLKWYLLFDESSPDGREYPKYIGRTGSAAVAKAHFEKCEASPYSSGKVIIVTDDEYIQADRRTMWGV